MLTLTSLSRYFSFITTLSILTSGYDIAITMASKRLIDQPEEILDLILTACLVASAPLLIPYSFRSAEAGDKLGAPRVQKAYIA